MTPPFLRFTGQDAPSQQDVEKCIHCGMCLQACPTYVTTKLEAESPRGRLALVRAVQEGRLPPTSHLTQHLEHCVQCLACQTVCPAGVPYGRIIEGARAQIAQQPRRPLTERIVRRVVLRWLFTQPSRLRSLAFFLQAYQRTGLQQALRHLRLLKLAPRLRQLDAQLPPPSPSFVVPSDGTFHVSGRPRHRVGLLSGCVMPLVYGPVNQATVRVLVRNGCEVVVPRRQACCGALHVHAGEREAARALARRNIDAFLETDVQWVVVNSAGCGSAMKGYGELLQRDEAYQAKAERFSTMLQDVHEFLIKIGFQVPAGPLERRVTYQDPCHLLHGQRVRSAPRQILQAIPGLELVEMAEADMCCGAGGLYNVLYPAFAGPILERKLDHIKRAAPHIVATANPGCMMQFQGGAASRRLPVRVAHVMELLDEAYQKTP